MMAKLKSTPSGILMERSPDGTGACKELADHPLDALSESGLVEVNTEDILTAVESLDATDILVSLADGQRSHDSLKLGEQWVG